MSTSKRATLYLAMSYLGAFSVALLVLATVFEWAAFLRGLAIGMLLISLGLLLRRTLRDEYFDELWKAGVSLAFVATVAWFLFIPFAEGFMHGLLDVPSGSNLPADLGGLIAIAAFFVGFHLKRLRSA